MCAAGYLRAVSYLLFLFVWLAPIAVAIGGIVSTTDDRYWWYFAYSWAAVGWVVAIVAVFL